MKPSREVEEALDHVWAVFAEYRVREPVAVCSHCTDEGALRAMVATPVREWSRALVAEHAYAVAVTAIDVQYADGDGAELGLQLRALLPRYLRSVLDGDGLGSDQMTPYGVVRYRDTWEQQEIEALDAFWMALIAGVRGLDDLGSIVETAINTGASAALVISAVDGKLGPEAVNAVADLRRVLSWEGGVLELPLVADFGSCREEAGLLRDWLLSPDQDQRLEAAIADAVERGDEGTWTRLWRGLEVNPLST